MILLCILPFEPGLSQGCGVAGDEEAGLEGDSVLPGRGPEDGWGESWVLWECDAHEAAGQLDMESRWGPVAGGTQVSAQH